MPCGKHPRSDKTCTDCYVADLLQLHTTINGSTGATNVSEVNNTILRLRKSAPDMSKDSASQELCRALVGNVNLAVLQARPRHKMLQRLELFVNQSSVEEGSLLAPSDPGAITASHRRAYRTLVRRQGTWAGISELQAIARGFRVRLAVSFRQTGATILVGPVGGLHIRNLALVFEDNHYDVRGVHAGDDGNLVLGQQIPTNPRGDCAFESVLTILAAVGIHRTHTEAARARLVARFALLRGQHAGPGPVPRGGDYPAVMEEFRAWLATTMDDDEIDDAIVAMAGCVLRRPTASGGEEGALDWSLSLPKDGSLPDLPWRGLDFVLRTKQIGADSFTVQAFDQVIGCARVAGANFNPARGLWADSMELMARWPVTGKGLVPVEGMYTEVLDKKELEFLADAGLEAGKPTHINTCLVEITTGKNTFYFLCGGINAEFGTTEKTKAQMCLRGQGNGTHSEKFCLGVVQLLLRGFGVASDPALLKSLDSFGNCTEGRVAASASHGVTSVRLLFLNIAPPCVTCQGYWGRVRAYLMEKQGIESVECAVLCYVDDIDSWKS